MSVTKGRKPNYRAGPVIGWVAAPPDVSDRDNLDIAVTKLTSANSRLSDLHHSEPVSHHKKAASRIIRRPREIANELYAYLYVFTAHHFIPIQVRQHVLFQHP